MTVNEEMFEDYIRQDYVFLISMFTFLIGTIIGYFWGAI